MPETIPELRFHCTGCGKCCTGDPARHYVEVSRAEQKRIYTRLGLAPALFRRRYLETAADDSEGIRLLENGRCPFLNDREQCDIYDIRPNQCMTYPFWPELVADPSQWTLEKQRCEGIDQGPVISIEEIRSRLALAAK